MTTPTPPAAKPVDLTALAAEVQAMTRYYGDWLGLYDSAQMFAHVRLLLNAWPEMLAELSAARLDLPRLSDERDGLLGQVDKLTDERDDYREGQLRALRDRERVEQEMDARLAEAWRERDTARQEAQQAREVERRAFAFAEEMRTYCSPYGLASIYADRLEAALNSTATPAPQPQSDDLVRTLAERDRLGRRLTATGRKLHEALLHVPSAVQAELRERWDAQDAALVAAAPVSPAAVPLISSEQHEYGVTYDGDTMWLECAPCRERDSNSEWLVIAINPGATWDELSASVAEHEAVPAASTQDAADSEAGR